MFNYNQIQSIRQKQMNIPGAIDTPGRRKDTLNNFMEPSGGLSAYSLDDQNNPFGPHNNQQFSIQQEPDIEYEDTIYYLNINSVDRDSANYPLQYDFKLKLNTVYKNVSCVECISVIFPNVSGITNEPYLILDIEELNTVHFSNNSNACKGFAVCPLKNPNQVSGGWVLSELGPAFHTASVYKTPKDLSLLTIKVKDMYGEIYDFGVTNGSTTKSEQISFIIKITCQDVSRKKLQLRNVY